MQDKSLSMKPNSVIRLDTNLLGFFRQWFEILKPWHKLTSKQMDVAAAFVKLRYELSKVITDENILDENVMSENSKRKIREECGISHPHFQVIMGELRKNNVIINKKINPKFIPRINNENGFQLLFYFEFKNE